MCPDGPFALVCECAETGPMSIPRKYNNICVPTLPGSKKKFEHGCNRPVYCSGTPGTKIRSQKASKRQSVLLTVFLFTKIDFIWPKTTNIFHFRKTLNNKQDVIQYFG